MFQGDVGGTDRAYISLVPAYRRCAGSIDVPNVTGTAGAEDERFYLAGQELVRHPIKHDAGISCFLSNVRKHEFGKEFVQASDVAMIKSGLSYGD